ncbi:Uncharacterised protein [Capnocytophaga ochracea]|jgi:hypothetical protein|uniref:Uncharacterized protein n=1 Tax=Capnocytophaga ochracea TaxID=1018 RepID=A0A2X2RCG7_CAPOC|nr:Uncharacterised protein [Capnocytophaga ochracea]
MGYYMVAYGVKIPEIKAIFGSKSETEEEETKAIVMNIL